MEKSFLVIDDEDLVQNIRLLFDQTIFISIDRVCPVAISRVQLESNDAAFVDFVDFIFSNLPLFAYLIELHGNNDVVRVTRPFNVVYERVVAPDHHLAAHATHSNIFP